jgi:hypothetical protein
MAVAALTGALPIDNFGGTLAAYDTSNSVAIERRAT